MEAFRQDLRYGFRMLVKKPGFTVVAVLTLALGIGANTAIFSIINAVLLEPLPYKDPDRIVAVWESKKNSKWRVAPANFLDWRRESSLFEEMATFGSAGFNLTGEGEPEQLLGARVSSGYFKVLGVDPILGRSFLPGEDEPGRERVVVLGYDLWKRRFGSDPGIIGKSIKLDGNSYTVVGVMPAGIYPTWPMTSSKFQFQSSHQQFWVPMIFSPQWSANRRTHVLGVIGRLKSGITIAQSRTEMENIAQRLEKEYVENREEGIVLNRLMDEVVGEVRPALLVLLGTVFSVLLIACANVANLLLARFISRQKEIAIRSALGASRWRLVRQFFLEGLLLSLLGGAAGILLAVFGVDLIMKIIPQEIPRLNQVGLDMRVLGFTLLLSFLTSLIFGIAPAIQSSRPNMLETLKEGGRSNFTGSSRQGFRRLLVVSQVSLAVVLLIGAGLLVKSFHTLQQVDPGFNPDNVLVLDLLLPRSKYGEWHQVKLFHAQLLERISRLPGVRSAAVGYDQPLQATWINSFSIEGRLEGEQPSGRFCPVSPNYFSTLGIELLRGRTFTDLDDSDHPGAVIINETLVRKYFPDKDPLGKRLQIDPPSMIWGNVMPRSFEVVGIVKDVKNLGLDAGVEPGFYVPAWQSPMNDLKVLVRTEGDPIALVSTLRDTVWSLDPDQPIAQVKPMDGVMAESIARPRFNMLLMGLFGALALILASIGLYGLLSYTVTQRTHEIGIRMALGAQWRDIIRLVVLQGLILTLVGIGAGVTAALILTRLLSSLLFGTSATDPLTFIAMSSLLVIVALLASFIPAFRATRVDPMIALRYE